MNCLPYVARVLVPILFILVEGGNVLAADPQKADSLPGAIPPEIEKSLRLAADENRDLSDRMPVALKELIERDKSHHDVLAALVTAMKDKDARIRCASVYVVGFLAPNQKTLLPVVERLIDDKDLRVRLAACESAWTIGRSEKAVRAAAALLDNPAETVRFHAASLIADMGEGAASAAPKLVNRLSEPNELIGLCVGKALDKMGRAALEPLLKKTNDPSAQVRQLAIAYLGSIKIADPRITEAILVAMGDTDWEVRHSAVGAVEDLQIRGPLVTEKLMARLNDPEDMIFVAAAKTLAEMGVKEAIPSLEKAIVERHMSADREEIAWCLGKLRAASAIPTLEKMLLQKTTVPSYSYGYDATSKMYSMTVDGTTTKYETDRSVRVAIVTALGEMGPAAIPTLERAKNDPEQSVREAAAESLQRISSEEECQPTVCPTSYKCRRFLFRRCHRQLHGRRFHCSSRFTVLRVNNPTFTNSKEGIGDSLIVPVSHTRDDGRTGRADPVIRGIQEANVNRNTTNVILHRRPIFSCNHGACSPTLGLLRQEDRRTDLVTAPPHTHCREMLPLTRAGYAA